MKILNLYACLGGNRYKWDEIPGLEITAVEWDEELARLYQERFPNDTVIVADAHQYLLDHYKEFDFIWSSPPCPTHSRLAMSNKTKESVPNKYPDMTLYQEIIFLQYYYTGKFVVENVIPYYEPLIQAQKRGRHLYWSNIKLPANINERPTIGISSTNSEVKKLCEFHDYNFYQYKGKQPLNKIARNLVDYEAGLSILKAALNIIEKSKTKQIELF
jgi:DNA (cytosine-5)-methyltransferase 1